MQLFQNKQFPPYNRRILAIFYYIGVKFMNGERLSELRKDKGYTQQQLAELLSVSKYTISSYENEKTSPDDRSLIFIAKLFNISLDYLMGLIDTPVSYNREHNCLQLPSGFTDLQLDQIQEYIEFLEFRNKRQS